MLFDQFNEKPMTIHTFSLIGKQWKIKLFKGDSSGWVFFFLSIIKLQCLFKSRATLSDTWNIIWPTCKNVSMKCFLGSFGLLLWKANHSALLQKSFFTQFLLPFGKEDWDHTSIKPVLKFSVLLQISFATHTFSESFKAWLTSIYMYCSQLLAGF